MWERLWDASLLTAGAIAMFLVFTIILFVYEYLEDKKKRPVRRPQLRVIRCEKTKRAAN
ncbi:MAG: hypothetical protein ACOX8N_08780 [Christensenellales bacterium]|jgi:hypothetical protein